MVNKGNLAIDERGLIFEAYRIDGITGAECRSIFLDWALSAPNTQSFPEHLKTLLDEYGANNQDHPMTAVIKEGLEKSLTSGKRRGGRAGRHTT